MPGEFANFTLNNSVTRIVNDRSDFLGANHCDELQSGHKKRQISVIKKKREFNRYDVRVIP